MTYPMMTAPERRYYQAMGQRIRTARLSKHYTQAQLGRLLGVSAVAVSYWESARTRPQIFLLRRLERLLGVEIEP